MAGSRPREGGRPGVDLGLSHKQWEPWMVFEQERHALFGMFQGTSADLSSVLSSSRWDGETQAGRSPGTLGGSTGSGLLRGDGGKAEPQQVKKGRGVMGQKKRRCYGSGGRTRCWGSQVAHEDLGVPASRRPGMRALSAAGDTGSPPRGPQIHTSNGESDYWRRGVTTAGAVGSFCRGSRPGRQL